MHMSLKVLYGRSDMWLLQAHSTVIWHVRTAHRTLYVLFSSVAVLTLHDAHFIFNFRICTCAASLSTPCSRHGRFSLCTSQALPLHR